MKKFLKIFLISLGSLVVVVAIAIAIVLWFVLTPEKLTPIVRNQATKYIHCQSKIGQVELTFFSTFPKFGLKADQLTLVNPVDGAPNDTLFDAKELIGIIDIRSLIKNNELIVSDFRLSNGSVNAFVDSLGNSNFDIFSTGSSVQPDTAQTGVVFKVIDIGNVDLKNIDVSYFDQAMNLKAEARQLSANINGSMAPGHITGTVNAKPFDVLLEYRQTDSSALKTEIRSLSFQINGSLNAGVIDGVLDMKLADILLQYGSVNTSIKNLSMAVNGKADAGNISGDIRLEPFNVTFGLGNEKYLQNAVVRLNTTADVDFSRQLIHLKEASVTVNGLKLDVAGTVENDTLHKNMIADVMYKFNSWPVKSIMALIPPSFASYVKGIDADGKLSSEGRIDGIYNASSFPMADIRLLLEDGALKYNGFPVPLSEVNADVNIRTDLKSPQSYVRIDRFRARTPGSSFKTAGTLSNLFADIRANLDTDLNLSLPEFAPLIPDSMKITAKGTVSGKVKSAFTLSQITKMQLDRMKLSGSLALSGLAVTYDSLSLQADRSVCHFALPNPNPSTTATGFVFANIQTDSLKAGKIKTFDASLANAEITLEASDVRDTTAIPNVLCSFRVSDLRAGTDSIHIVALGPAGNITVAPRNGAPKYPAIQLAYQGDSLQADFGQNSITAGKTGIELALENDPAGKDVVSQWMPKGFINMEQGKVAMASLLYPIEIPSVKMKLEPETFAIEKLNAVINKSDFNLSGKLNNVSAYFRGDSLLRGDFDFVSGMTDILQLMNLTNGMGQKEEEQTTMGQDNSALAYMVPQGIDVTLHTNISNVTYGKDITASGIKGDIRVHDGILVLDGLTFTTPAADMQVTAMYRTPRKNHLFVGLNLHMFDIEIGELLQMIPAIDSIMPMLRSFGGKGEFHIAAETYVDSMYRVKMPTIRGASSIRGNDLVLMDGQTFSEIAKKLRFSKKTVNKVDSLSAEFTIFRNEVDVYPFLIVMDKYKAVVGGRHNLDMSFDYNISVVQSPLPFRLAVNVKGTPEKMKFGLGKSKYPDFYRPASRKVVETQEVALRKMIRNALMGTIIKDQ